MQPTTNREFRNSPAELLHRLGTALTNPFSHHITSITKSYFAREPAPCYRAGAAIEDKKAALPVSILKALPTLPRAFIGAGFRTIATRFRGSFSFYQPATVQERLQAKEQSMQTERGKLKIMSYNVCAMPEFISYRNELKHPMERLDGICSEIRDGDAEVVCLQEAFHTEFSTALIEKLKDKYPYAICNAGVSSFKLSSGNLILSKHPIVRAEYEPYHSLGGHDAMASKGPLIITIEKHGNNLNIIDTHLNGGAPGGGGPFRERQLTQMHAFASKYFEKSPYPTLLAADTNIGLGEFSKKKNRWEPADPEMTTLLKYFEVFGIDKAEGTSVSVAENIHRDQCVDWICHLKGVLDGHIVTLCSLSTLDKYEASDHKAILATLSIIFSRQMAQSVQIKVRSKL
jgi:endonuclease/exonuclease/phosphatase family metal-dependent hydrolase